MMTTLAMVATTRSSNTYIYGVRIGAVLAISARGFLLITRNLLRLLIWNKSTVNNINQLNNKSEVTRFRILL